MDIHIQYLPTEINEWELTRQLASRILHLQEFHPRASEDERLLNFKVKLDMDEYDARNIGTGTLTLPDPAIGDKFLNWVKMNPFKLGRNKVRFYRSNKPPPRGLALTLQKTPYISPDIEEMREQKLRDLRDGLRVDAIQFGFLFRSSYPSRPGEHLKSRSFSVEWARDYSRDSVAWLSFEYDHKLIRIKLGNDMTDTIGSSILINFSSITKIGLGYDGSPYAVFDTLTPPTFEEEDFHRAQTGNHHEDNQKYKRRVGSLHPGHGRVAPYAQKLRITLYNDPNEDIIEVFRRYCRTAELADNLILTCVGPAHIEAAGFQYLKDKTLYNLRLEFHKLDWPVAFQMESLLHNCLLHTQEIQDLLPRVRKLCQRHPEDGCIYAAELLRSYCIALQARSPKDSPFKCFEGVLSKFVLKDNILSPGTFRCSHVTFAPTRLLLEGPYPVQSNRVIRRYKGYEDHFIRVDFRDENRLNYRWDREVDGKSFVQDRVGSVLKQGFSLAGRRFEFLAYSSSALREHAVWFMNPFNHPSEGYVDAERVRSSIGDFIGTALLKCPSKYAARLAQAFTATDPSVKIKCHEWEEVDDIGTKPYLFTDGVGTISEELGHEIWEALCALRRDHGRFAIEPSAYQIRFLGYKGVVAVDKQLDKSGTGIRMRLRPSMKKFESSTETEADIEIAQAFEKPNTSYLNRPLVTLLEGRRVRKETFEDLLDKAVADVYTADDSIGNWHNFLRGHSLGQSYRLPWLLSQFERFNCDIRPQKEKQCIENAFFKTLRDVARVDVLREIKQSARIPIPESFHLVGVSDEGPAYEKAGYQNVFTLKAADIYVCIQRPGGDPHWIEGPCSISRSPVAHPGDVQRVHAIGKPPADKLCLFSHMKNVVVLPSVGSRSLASCLGGGDLDGDQYDIICHAPLLPPENCAAADYPPGQTLTLDRDSTVEDICDFIVEYINSDVLGLLSDRLLVIADQSKEGIFDEACLKLARLSSQAVDFPKQGIPVDLDKDKLPRTLIRPKPDWHAAEVVGPRKTDYYESDRALGSMYRRVALDEPEDFNPDSENPPAPNPYFSPLKDPISLVLLPLVKARLQPYIDPNGRSPDLQSTFKKYSDELRYICATHTLSNTPGVRLLEEEVVIGTILAKCSQKRWRKDRIYRMRLHASMVAEEVQRSFYPPHLRESDTEDLDSASLLFVLERAWWAWDLSLREGAQGEFGANSFGLIALRSIFFCLDELQNLGAADPIL